MRLLLLILAALSLTWSSTSSAYAKIGEPCARAEARVSGARAGADGTQGRRLYAQARYLDANTGRFLSLDPVAGALGEPLSTHGALYARASPTRFTDPDGRFDDEAFATCKEREIEAWRRSDSFAISNRGYYDPSLRIHVLGRAEQPDFAARCRGEAYDWADAAADVLADLITLQVAYYRLSGEAAFSYYDSAGELVERRARDELLIASNRVHEGGGALRGHRPSAAGEAIDAGLERSAAAGGVATRTVVEAAVFSVVTGVAAAEVKGLATNSPLAKAAETQKGTLNAVKPYDVGTYEELKKRSLSGDKLDIDHQPSHASNVARAEAELGRPLDPDEIEEIRKKGTAVAVPVKTHRGSSPTYGGRNNKARIQSDATDMHTAVERDTAAMEAAAGPADAAAAKRAADEVRKRAGIKK